MVLILISNQIKSMRSNT